MVAHEVALSRYWRAWQQPAEYFEARRNISRSPDKAARTVALLSERLDQHRGRGQQQITVKHARAADRKRGSRATLQNCSCQIK
jgi:hypothetical protein